MINTEQVLAALKRLPRDAEPGALEESFDLNTNLGSGKLTSFFIKFFDSAYVAVNGASERVAKLRVTLPVRADELPAALRTYRINSENLNFVCHSRTSRSNRLQTRIQHLRKFDKNAVALSTCVQ